MTKYSVGDIVRVGKGKSEWIITEGWGYGAYLVKSTTGTSVREEYGVNLTLLRTKEQNEQQKQEIKMASKLYQIKGTETFINQIGTNQEGKAVVEVKGTGEIRVVDKVDLVEVVPFTITVRNLANEALYHFTARPDLVKEGDLLVVNGRLLCVTGLNTKVENAKELPATAVRLVTSPL